MKKNKEVARLLEKIGRLLEIKGVEHKPWAYRRAADSIRELGSSLEDFYEKGGIEEVKKIPGVGESIAEKVEQYLKEGKIKYLKELGEETAIRRIVTHYFKTKGLSLEELKRDARKKKIVYSRYTRPAKELLELAGSVEEAKQALDTVAEWANSRDLDYAIETVAKKWLELDRLEPKEVVKKPYYRGKPMVWSKTHRKWYVISPRGEWLEFAGKKEDIEWRVEK